MAQAAALVAPARPVLIEAFGGSVEAPGCYFWLLHTADCLARASPSRPSLGERRVTKSVGRGGSSRSDREEEGGGEEKSSPLLFPLKSARRQTHPRPRNTKRRTIPYARHHHPSRHSPYPRVPRARDQTKEGPTEPSPHLSLSLFPHLPPTQQTNAQRTSQPASRPTRLARRAATHSYKQGFGAHREGKPKARTQTNKGRPPRRRRRRRR